MAAPYGLREQTAQKNRDQMPASKAAHVYIQTSELAFGHLELDLNNRAHFKISQSTDLS